MIKDSITHFLRRVLALALVLAFAGCRSAPNTACVQSTTPTNSVEQITHATNNQSLVATLGFSANGQSMLIGYTDGEFVEVELANRSVMRSLKLTQLTPGLTRLSENRNLLITAGDNGIKAWDTATGDVLHESKEKTKIYLNDIALSNDGNWLIEGTNGLNIYSPTENKGRSGYGISIIGYSLSPRAVAFNSTGTRVIYALQEMNLDTHKVRGKIRMLNWDGRVLEGAYRFELGEIKFPFERVTDQVPLRLTIDPSDQWVAARTLSAIELDTFALSQHATLNIPSTSFGSLAFNPPSTLLAVGIQQGLRVYSVPDLNEVLDQNGPEASAIAFSPDGCLLAWGDVEGTVHIINAPKP